MPHLFRLRMGAFLPSQDLARLCRRLRHGVSVADAASFCPVPSKTLAARSVLLLQARSEPHAVFFGSTLHVSTDVGSKPRQVSCMTTDLCKRLELVMTSEFPTSL